MLTGLVQNIFANFLLSLKNTNGPCVIALTRCHSKQQRRKMLFKNIEQKKLISSSMILTSIFSCSQKKEGGRKSE
jgi:hypothetical protein